MENSLLFKMYKLDNSCVRTYVYIALGERISLREVEAQMECYVHPHPRQSFKSL